MNLNKAFVLGNLAADPEFRTTMNGQEVATIRIATNRVWNNQAGEKQEAVEFHRVVLWGRLAQLANQYLTKGRLVMIEGRIQTRSYEGKDGLKRYQTEIVAENLQLGPRFQGEPKTITTANSNPTARNQTRPVAPEEIPVVNEDEPPTNSDEDVEETSVDLKDIPF
ncbi:MAG: single-stranded DNA-binding protein [Parcubacteria group bacterium]|nr:single-stranded DNA-binding protein [Parcubacteria group bacterium]